MNIKSGVFVGDGSLAVSIEGHALELLRQDCEPRTLVSGYEDIRFLTASRFGEYLAFWSITGESFRLIDLAGNRLWSSWINSDKAVAQGIHFSVPGDAVACLFHFDGLPGMFFCDFKEVYSTTFGCSGSPIGYDTDLRYFALDDHDRYELETPGFYEKDHISGNILKLPPDAIMSKLKKSPLLVDRNRCILPGPVIPARDWQSLAILDNLSGFVVLKDCNLYWFDRDSDEPAVTIRQCIPEEDRFKSFCTMISLCGDNALIRIGDRFTVANRNHGVVWREENLSCVTLRGQRVFAQYAGGTVDVIKSDASIEMRCPPPTGFRTVATDILENVLYIAYMSERSCRIEIKTFRLRHLNELTAASSYVRSR